MASAERVMEPPAGVLDRDRRALTVGLLLVVSLFAFEALAVATVLPAATEEIGGLSLYGWAFSAFLLASLVTTIAAGEWADRAGPLRPFGVGLVLFGGGLILAGLAPTMPVFIIGRALQGGGAGACVTMAYVGISRGYPDALRARMLALLSSAWVAPALIGPAVAGALADRLSWRLAFLALLPLLVVAGVLTLPALRTMAIQSVQSQNRGRLLPALRLTAGAGLVLGALSIRTPAPAIALLATGALLAVPALLRLLPSGTLRARPGIPAGLAVNALLNFGFFTAEAFLPLALTSVRGFSTGVAGLALTVASLTWTAGAWMQARLDARAAGRGRAVRVAAGCAFVLLGIVVTAAAVLAGSLPLLVAWAGWGIAGLGMGLAYPTVSLIVLRQAASGQEGHVSGSLRLAELLSVAIGTGVGGAVIAAAGRFGHTESFGLGIAFAIAVAGAAIGLLLAPRLRDDPQPRVN